MIGLIISGGQKMNFAYGGWIIKKRLTRRRFLRAVKAMVLNHLNL
jgi:16S rRNA C1402 (ribose-2'-O) methylase RsmI